MTRINDSGGHTAPLAPTSPTVDSGQHLPDNRASSVAGLPRRTVAVQSAAPRSQLPPRDGSEPSDGVGPMLRKNAMTALTGACLAAEGRSHFIQMPHKATVRALIGHTQAHTGLLGIAHYGAKFLEKPDFANAMGLVASILFGSEGGARMIEGEKAHLRVSSALGFGAAVAKTAVGTSVTAPLYLIDAGCNGAEYAHSVANPKGWRLIAHHLTHTWKTSTLAAVQRGTGRVMMLAAAQKALAQDMSRDVTLLERDLFVKMVDKAYEKLDGDTWESALAVAEKQSPDAALAKLRELARKLVTDMPTTPQRFARVTQDAPKDAVAIMKALPRQSREALMQLRHEDPSSHARLKERFGVQTPHSS
jgi:hypothetical protein